MAYDFPTMPSDESVGLGLCCVMNIIAQIELLVSTLAYILGLAKGHLPTLASTPSCHFDF